MHIVTHMPARLRSPRRHAGLAMMVAAALLGQPLAASSAFAQQRYPKILPAKRVCTMNAIERSKCAIEAILAELARSYKLTGGGGITEIRQNTSTSYTVSIAQEERVDQFTYEVEIDSAGKVTILNVKESTKSPRH